jgi:hypothetical protein
MNEDSYLELMNKKMLSLFGEVGAVLKEQPVVKASLARVVEPAVTVVEVRPQVLQPLPKKAAPAAVTSAVPTKTAVPTASEHFTSCVQSLRSLVFDEMGHSKWKKTSDKARLGNFREHKILALGGKADKLAKHSTKHLRAMRQAKTRKLEEATERRKKEDVVGVDMVKFRAGEVERRKKSNEKEKHERKKAGMLLSTRR